jgi:glucosamine-6-phosphate deaminase
MSIEPAARALNSDAEMTVDNLVVKAFAARYAMAKAAADDIAAEIAARLAHKERIRVLFSAAPSQLPMLDYLAKDPRIDWERITAFQLDEFVGLDLNHPAAFGNWLVRFLFSKVPVGEYHRLIPGADPAAAALAYSRLLLAAPIDIACLGIGVNGHIAFNDPPVADFQDPELVKLVELDEICRQQQHDDGSFPTVDAVPQHALTLTIPCILHAERIFCVVPGEAKRNAVEATLFGPVATACPASILRHHPEGTLYLDEGSSPEALMHGVRLQG